MFDFIQRHQRFILIIMGSVIVIMLVVLFVVNRGGGGQTNNSQNSNTDNSLDYQYIKTYSDPVDQNILLTAHIAVEEFGTYSSSDFSGLNDLLNQSTSEFKPKVQALIDAAPSSQPTITTADPDSFELTKQGNTATVTMDVTTVSGGQTSKKYFTVDLIKSGNFWLINNITSNE